MLDMFSLPVPALPTLTERLDGAAHALTKLGLTLGELKTEAAKVDPAPSEEQKDTGNYKKGHVNWKGLRITIETAAGQYRRGVDKDGKPWKTLMKDMYGYIKGTESAADGDHVDVFLSTDADLRSELVFVVNQLDPDTGKFDEGKVILGCVDEESAKATYLRNYQPGWQGLGSITALTLPQFKWWLEHGDTGVEIKDGYFAAPANRKKAAQATDTERAADARYRPLMILSKRASDDEDMPFTIAVDFDGTLVEKQEPFDQDTVGKVREGAKEWMQRFHDAGARLIIFTVRGKTKIVEDCLKEHDIPYDYINENPDQPPDSSGKLFAHVYWDDRAVNAQDLESSGAEILRRLHGEDEGSLADKVLTIERVRITMTPLAVFLEDADAPEEPSEANVA